MLHIFENLFSRLNTADVPFCNWKSHHALESYLKGNGDLDLFIPSQFKSQFEKIAVDEGFKLATSYQANHDHIEHYYGLDRATLNFAHIHVYFKIITGEHVSKNYILPLDNFVLNNLETYSNLPVINSKLRRNIFLIRYFLKIGSLYGLAQYLRELEKYRNEWDSINQESEHIGMRDLALSSKEFQKMSSTYTSSSLLKKFLLSLRLKRQLKVYKKRSYFQHKIFEIKNFITRILNKLYFKKQKLLNPGIVIAICGLDGSGKSSLVSALNNIFSEHFCTKVFHLGRPASSLITFSFNLLIKIERYLKKTKLINKNKRSVNTANNISLVYAIRSVMLAYDRKIDAMRAHRYSKDGYVSICDRYPGLGNGKMDSPRIPLNDDRGIFYQFCYNLEKKLYESIKPANMIFQLSVPLQIAIERNNKREKVDKETEDELRERFLLNSEAVFLGEQYSFIDASVSFEDVLNKVANLIWYSKTWKVDG